SICFPPGAKTVICAALRCNWPAARPRSAPGKAVSRLNALKSGIDANSHVIPNEDPAELEALAERYYLRWQPATPEEIFLLDAMIAADWLKRRMNKVEAQLWTHQIKTLWSDDHNVPLGKSFTHCDSAQMRLQRRLDAADRSFNRSMAALRSLKDERRKSVGDAPAEATVEQPGPVLQPVAPKPVCPEIGFVPHSLPAGPGGGAAEALNKKDARRRILPPAPGPASEASPSVAFRRSSD
ncbi:MAG TPA: hypothetical protein VH951_00515, partial [Dehalococcoidia bacterium]